MAVRPGNLGSSTPLAWDNFQDHVFTCFDPHVWRYMKLHESYDLFCWPQISTSLLENCWYLQGYNEHGFLAGKPLQVKSAVRNSMGMASSSFQLSGFSKKMGDNNWNQQFSHCFIPKTHGILYTFFIWWKFFTPTIGQALNSERPKIRKKKKKNKPTWALKIHPEKKDPSKSDVIDILAEQNVSRGESKTMFFNKNCGSKKQREPKNKNKTCQTEEVFVTANFLEESWRTTTPSEGPSPISSLSFFSCTFCGNMLLYDDA